MELLAARLRRKNDFEYPPLTLWIFSAEGLFLFRVCRGLRAAPNAIFTEGVVKGNGRCSAAFCESAALGAGARSPERADFPRPGEDVTAGDKKGNLSRSD